MDIIIPVLIIIAVVAFVVCLQQFIWRPIIRYEVTNLGITVRIFGVPASRTKIEDIIEVQKLMVTDWFKIVGIRMLINSMNLRNRLWGHAILIKRNRGFFIIRNVIISPDNPDEFISQINLLKAGLEGG